jgi:malonate transporter and related proteins
VQGALAGFAIIGIIIGLGFLLAQLRILDATAQGVLTRVAFYVATPALMITVLGETDVTRLLSANLIASLGSVVVATPSSRHSVPPMSMRATSACRSPRTLWATRH